MNLAYKLIVTCDISVTTQKVKTILEDNSLVKSIKDKSPKQSKYETPTFAADIHLTNGETLDFYFKGANYTMELSYEAEDEFYSSEMHDVLVNILYELSEEKYFEGHAIIQVETNERIGHCLTQYNSILEDKSFEEAISDLSLK